MVSATGSKSMELEGNLGAFHLPDILRFLAMGRMTGILTLVNEGRTIRLSIKEGLLVGAASPERYLKLGQLLVYSGQITRRELEEVLDGQQGADSGKPLGEYLIERRLVKQEQVEQAIQLQVKEELWELFSWTDGNFKFEHGLPRAMERVIVAMEIEPLIEESHRRLEQWHTILRTLSDPKEVFRVRSDVGAPPDTKLHPNTWRVLSLINGRHSLQSLTYLSGIGKFETLCAIDRLLSLQLIEPVKTRPQISIQPPEPVSAAAAPAQPTQTERKNSPNNTGEWGNNNTTGIRSLFGFKRRNATSADVESRNSSVMTNDSLADLPGNAVGPFFTSVALACAIINRMLDRLNADQEFRGELLAGEFCYELWNDIGLRFPRADLIQFINGQLNATMFDRYVRMAGGIQPSLLGCLEDSMEALTVVGQQLRSQARERIGSRVDQMLVEAARPYLDGVEVTHPADFSARQWTRLWLGGGN